MSPTKQARGDSGKEPKLHRWQNGEKTLRETRLSRGASSPPARWTSSLFQLQQSQIVSDEWRQNGWRPFSGSFGHGGVIRLCDWQCKTDSYRRPLHVTPGSEQMRSSSASWQRLSMSSGWNGLRLRSHLAAGWTSVFSRGAIKPPTNALSPSSPFFPFAPHSSRIRPSASAALTSVDGAEKKGYERMPPLDKSVAAHLYPPTAIGWKARASHPSKLCIYTVTPTRQLDKRLWRYTLRLCFRSSRPRCSPVRKPVWMQLHSGTWRAGQTWPCTPLKPPPKPLGYRCLAW